MRRPAFLLPGIFLLLSAGCGSLNQSLEDASAAGDARAVHSLISRGADPNGGHTWICSGPLCNPQGRGGPPLLCAKPTPGFAERHPVLMGLPVLALFPLCLADIVLARISGGSCDPRADKIPLLLAARSGKDDAARALIAGGANVGARAEDGSTALMFASERGDLPLVHALIGAGADVLARNNCGTTALMLAAKDARVDAVAALLGAGASVDVQDDHGWTALMFASLRGSPEAVRLILASGADRSLRNRKSLTALDIAREYGHSYAARLLEAPPGTLPPGGNGSSREKAPHSGVDSPSFAAPERPDDFAVVVGIEKYDLFAARALYAERDAESIGRYLQSLGVPENHLMLLVGPRATRSLLQSRLERWLSENVKTDSTVYFYFSGHGAPDPRNGRAYLLPYDGDPSDLKDTAYPIAKLYSVLAALRAHRVLVLLDSCFSGAGGRSVIAAGARPLVTVQPDAPQGAVKAMSAAGPDQVAGDMPGQGHGLFTYYLLKGLNGGAVVPLKGVSVKSLFDYLKPRVEDQAKLEFRSQDPELLPADWLGDWTLRPATASASGGQNP